MSEQTLKRLLYVAVGSAVVYLFIFPFLYPVGGHDAWIHLNWLDQFTAQFREGNVYPRWMPDSFSGFGSPAFYYYPPLSYWLAGVISFVVPASSETLYHCTATFASVFSGLSMYLLLREMQRGRAVTLLASVIYITTSYRFVNIFMRASLGEHVAFIFLPLILLGIENSWNNKRLHPLFFSAIGWGGVLLTNIPLSMMMAVVAPVYCVIRFKRDTIRFTYLPLLGSLLGLMIAAVYLIPAISLSEAVQMNHLWDLFGDDHYLDTILMNVFHTRDVIMHVSNISFAVCAAIVGILMLTGRHAFGTLRKNGMLIACSVLLLLSFLLQFSFTGILWEQTFFQYIQLPWRLNAVGTLLLPIAFALVVDTKWKYSHWLPAGVLFLSITTSILALAMFRNVEQPPYEKYRNDPPEYVTPFAGNDPYKMENIFAAKKNDLFVTQTDSAYQITISLAQSNLHNEYLFSYTSANTFDIHFHLQYFPLWKLTEANGDTVRLKPNSMGLLSAELPAGKHSYILTLRKTQEEKVGAWISALAVAITAFVGIFVRRKNNNH